MCVLEGLREESSKENIIRKRCECVCVFFGVKERERESVCKCVKRVKKKD
jgi:hypothetical protein